MTFILTEEDKKRLYLLKAHLDSVQNKELDLEKICSDLEELYLNSNSLQTDSNIKTVTDYINKKIRKPLKEIYILANVSLVPASSEVAEKTFDVLIGLGIYWPLNNLDENGFLECCVSLAHPIKKAKERAILVSGHQAIRDNLQEWWKTRYAHNPGDNLFVSEREVFFNYEPKILNKIISEKFKSDKVALQRKYERDPKESRKERIVMVFAAVLFAAAFIATAIFCPPVAAVLTLNYIVCFGFMGTIVSGITGFLTSHCHTMRKCDKEFSVLVNEEHCRMEAKYGIKKTNEFLGELLSADTLVQNDALKKENTKIHSPNEVKITESSEEKALDNKSITSESSLNNVSHAVTAPCVENNDLAINNPVGESEANEEKTVDNKPITLESTLDNMNQTVGVLSVGKNDSDIKKLLSKKEELREKRVQYYKNKNYNEKNNATQPVAESAKISAVIQPVAHKKTNWSSSLFSCKNDVMNADVVNNNQEICAASLVS